jgi:hypothetical protein
MNLFELETILLRHLEGISAENTAFQRKKYFAHRDSVQEMCVLLKTKQSPVIFSVLSCGHIKIFLFSHANKVQTHVRGKFVGIVEKNAKKSNM